MLNFISHTRPSLVPLLIRESRDKNCAVSKLMDAVTLIEGRDFYTEWTHDDRSAYAGMIFDRATEPQ